MNTIIEFRADKSKWETTPTFLGWDSILLLEDTSDRVVILGRDFGDDDVYRPWTNQQYLHFTGEDRINFFEEISGGNYYCIGILEDAAAERLNNATTKGI
tara:strand:- start:51 stop:350 length:300 start_codon:yes stop_codon:yes gene_type:complete